MRIRGIASVVMSERGQRRLLALLAGFTVLVCALVISACGSSSPASTSDTSGKTPEKSSPESEASNSESSKPAEIADTTWVVPEAWREIDPTKIAATDEGAVNLVLEPLLLPNPEGGRALPNLATLKQTNPTTYVFDIRQGVKFTDGKPLTMEDIMYSLNLHFAKGSTSTFSTLGEVVKSMKQTGPMQLTITLNHPDLTFEVKIAQCGIVEKTVRETAGENPGSPEHLNVGTGPYVVETFKPGSELVLTRNENYWGKKPGLKTLHLKLVEDETAELLAARSGELTGAYEIPSSEADVYEETPGMHLVSGYNPSVVMFNMNTTKAPWNDIHVRKAVAYSIDRQGLVESVLKGHGEVATSVDQQENVESVLSSAEAEKLFGELDTYQFDTKKAEEEMAKSNHPDGFSETVVYDATAPDLGRVAQVIAQELEPLGIKLTVKSLPDQQYVNSVFFEHSVPSAVVDFTTDIQDPISLPNYLTASSNMLSNGGYTDIAEWSDPRMDKALETYLAGNVEDKAGQAKLLFEALKIMSEEEPYVPIYHSDYLAVLEDGLTYNHFNGFWWEFRWPDLIGTE